MKSEKKFARFSYMQDHKTLLDIFIDPLNSLGVRYMVTGSVASIVYGEPRLTHDVDLVVMLTIGDIAKLQKTFSEDRFYFPPVEVIRTEMARSSRGHFNIIDMETAYKADIYFVGNEPVQIWGFKNRRKTLLDDREFWIAAPEYVIVQKLIYWNEGKHQKHLDDVKAIIATNKPALSESEILAYLNSEELKAKFIELRDTASSGESDS